MSSSDRETVRGPRPLTSEAIADRKPELLRPATSLAGRPQRTVRSPFAYVREAYGVPAYRGARVWYHGTPGRIVHATSYVRVEFNAADARANPALRPYVRKEKPVRVTLHPCEKWLAYDRETPERRRPSGWGSHVWSELCHAYGVNPYGSDAERAVAYDPALREPWPRDPRSASDTRPGGATQVGDHNGLCS